MKLGTIRMAGTDTEEHTTCAIILSDPDEAGRTPDTVQALPVPGVRDVASLLAMPTWRDSLTSVYSASRSTSHSAARNTVLHIRREDLLCPVLQPRKIICVGVNYRRHIEEMGRELPAYPTVFTKFFDAVAAPFADVSVPSYATDSVDWEGELAIVIGHRVYQADESVAQASIAGFAIMNDATMRDYQNRTVQWHQGKSFYRSSGFGPWMTTTDECGSGLSITTLVNGVEKQRGNSADLVFSPATIVSYMSHIYPLNPGDVIATGTPSGVGFARSPKERVTDGDTVEVIVDKLGSISNTFRMQRS